MSEKGITTFWECECSAKNPLRFRKCKACGRDMPDSFAHKIYYEELKAQKAFVFVENAEKSKIRCLKIGSFLMGERNSTDNDNVSNYVKWQKNLFGQWYCL